MHNLNIHGYHIYERGMPIACVIIVNYDPELKFEGMNYETLYHPKAGELKAACERNGLPFEAIEKIVYGGSHDTHTLIIDVKNFLEANK